MVNIDFVPSDYVQQRESGRANFIYLILLAVTLSAIGATFSIIKVRQRAVENELTILNAKMLKAHEQIKQLEELKTKSKTILKSAFMTTELLEPVPKSVILACLTNNLPIGVSLLEIELKQKEFKKTSGLPAKASQYQNASTAAALSSKPVPQSIAKSLQTHIELKGISPSNIEVAAYIAQLSESVLVDTVELVESKENEIDNLKFQEFKLKMLLKNGALLTKKDIEEIRQHKNKKLI